MTQTFTLKHGEIAFENERIKISDNARKQNLLLQFSAALGAICGGLFVIRSLKTGERFFLWSGLFIGILQSVVFILYLFRTNQNEVALAEIKSIKVKNRFGNEFIDIRLKNNKLRRVNGVDNSEELAQYIQSNLETRLQ